MQHNGSPSVKFYNFETNLTLSGIIFALEAVDNENILIKSRERALWMAVKDSPSCFESLLEGNNYLPLHQKSLQLL